MSADSVASASALGDRARPSLGSWGLYRLVAALVALYAISVYNYAIFHTLIEAFCIVVAASVFIVVFNTRRLLDNHYLLFVGLGFLAFVALGVPHTLGYKGVQLFAGFDNDLPTQAFIAQRFFLATSFMVAPAFLRRRLDLNKTLALLLAATGIVLMSLLVWRNFPQMFVDPTGLTPLKKTLEIVLAAMFIVAAAGLLRHRNEFEPHVLRLIVASLACFIGSEVAFMLYATPFGLSNLGGHLFQLAAFWFIYRAVLVTALVNPFELLYRELARREASLSEANLHLSAVSSISDAAMSSLDTKTVVDTLLKRLVEIMSADAAILMIAEGKLLRTYATVGLNDTGFSLEIGQGFAGRIARERKPDFVLDAGSDDRVVSWIWKQEGIKSMLGVPLLAGDTLLGVLHVDWRTHHPYTAEELELLEAVADRFSLAIRNAQRYEGEHHVAQVLQESLLALPQEVDDVRFASVYRAAMQIARVGGDFYDVFEIDQDLLGVVIGDVSGKGLDAAVLTSLVRNTIRAHSIDTDKRPCDVMRATNAVLDRATDTGTFATVFFGVLDRRDGHLTYCNAGHTSVGVLRRKGAVEKLDAQSPLVGAFPDSEFASTWTIIAENDVLFLYTDGVIEARSGSALYGEDRLFALLATLVGSEPEHVAKAVMADVSSFTTTLSDDVALLVLQRNGTRAASGAQQTLGMDEMRTA